MSELSVRYNCVALAGVNKPAELKKDKDGYYYVLLSALNIFNSERIFYAFEESKHVFERSNVFMRKVKKGILYGEHDHPPFLPGMTEEEFMDRNEWIETKNVAMHIREVELVATNEMCNGLPVVEIWGWIKPDRAEGVYLQAALDNPHQNVCFSLRAIVRQGIVNGVTTRRIDKLITFDWVIEDGLMRCNKYDAIARDGAGQRVAQESTRTFVDRPITRETMENIVSSRTSDGRKLVAHESRGSELIEYCKELLSYAEPRCNIRKGGMAKRSW